MIYCNCDKKAINSPLFSSMHMLPKSHDSGFYKHAVGTEQHIDYSMVDTPQPEDVRAFYSLHNMLL